MRQNLSKNKLVRENAVTWAHGSCSLRNLTFIWELSRGPSMNAILMKVNYRLWLANGETFGQPRGNWGEGREEGRECSLFCTRRLRLISQTKYWFIIMDEEISNSQKTDVNTCIRRIHIIIIVFRRSKGADRLVSLSGSRKAEYQSRVTGRWITAYQSVTIFKDIMLNKTLPVSLYFCSLFNFFK